MHDEDMHLYKMVGKDKYDIDPECDKVFCALEKIWGADFASKMLYIRLKYLYNTSELAFTNSSRFRAHELDDILIALEDLPPHIYPTVSKPKKENQFKNCIK